MSSAILLNDKFENNGNLELPSSYSDINSHNLYLYCKSYLSSIRANTARVKNRSLVRGGGKKPKAQKGSGGARWGTLRSPLFVGGGQIFGPTKRNYTQKINRKQKTLALNFSINYHATNSSLFIVDSLKVKSGKTKDAVAIIDKLNQRDILIIVDSIDEKSYLSFRNIKNCYFIEKKEVNAYLISSYHSVLVEKLVFDELIKEV
jgi:large subunit ribosomal protein L4